MIDPASGRRERNRQARLARIKAAALAVFREKGYTGAATREIAARAEVSIATLFSYAREKRDLLLMIFSEEVERLTVHAFATLPADAPLLDRLEYVFRSRYELWGRDPDLSRHAVHEIFASPLLRTRPAAPEHMEAHLRDLFSAEQGAGRLDPSVSASVYARTVVDVYLSENLRWLAVRDPDIAEGIAEFRRVMHVVLRGMGSYRQTLHTMP